MNRGRKACVNGIRYLVLVYTLVAMVSLILYLTWQALQSCRCLSEPWQPLESIARGPTESERERGGRGERVDNGFDNCSPISTGQVVSTSLSCR